MNSADIENDIAASSSPELARELLAAFEELKQRYFRGDYRAGQLEGGRFAEAAFRILQYAATGSYTPVGKALPKLPVLLQQLESAPAAVHDSIRLHIPHTLRAVYDVRNRRDVGHIAADVDANRMDAELVVSACSWVLAEFVRLFHQSNAEEAHAYVEAIVARHAPLVQVLGTQPFVLRNDLAVREELLLLLYHQSGLGAALADLDAWTPSRISRKVISARLTELEQRDRFVRRVAGCWTITDTGTEYVESNLLMKP